jgi:uncharacterized membrane protein
MECVSDSHARSIIKAVTWKLTAVIITLVVGYWISGNWKMSAEITGIAAVIGLVAYYFHERIWNRIGWGRVSN